MAVDLGGEFTEYRAGLLAHQHGYRDVTDQLGARGIGEHRHRAVGDRVGGESGAVRIRAG